MRSPILLIGIAIAAVSLSPFVTADPTGTAPCYNEDPTGIGGVGVCQTNGGTCVGWDQSDTFCDGYWTSSVEDCIGHYTQWGSAQGCFGVS